MAGNLTIDVKDIRGTAGKLQVAVFNDEAGYKTADIDKAYAAFTLSIQPQTNAITLHDVPAGRYAVSLFHDENGNNDMETNIAGMPKEGYGTSNAPDKYDEPSFSRASVKAGDDNKVVEINMHYLGK